ncbi:hypothetical protein [Nocardioides ultimimeridianus]
MRTKRLPILGAIALLLGVLSPVAGLTTAAPADALTTSWRCGAVHTRPGGTVQDCVRLTRITPHVLDDKTYTLHNSYTNQSVNGHCTWTQSTTFEWSLSTSVKFEAGLIFEKVSGEISGGIKHSTTDATSVGGDFTIPPGKYAYCARGHEYFTVRGQLRRHLCASSGCYYSLTDFSAKAPKRSFIDFGPGPDADLSRFLPKA